MEKLNKSRIILTLLLTIAGIFSFALIPGCSMSGEQILICSLNKVLFYIFNLPAYFLIYNKTGDWTFANIVISLFLIQALWSYAIVSAFYYLKALIKHKLK